VRFGQPIFDPKNSGVLYATGYELTEDGRMLGIKFCFNRPSGIWRLIIPQLSPTEGEADINTECTIIDVETTQNLLPLICRSPRVLDTGGRSLLIWLACDCGGAHMSTTTLHRLDITLASNRIEDKALHSHDIVKEDRENEDEMEDEENMEEDDEKQRRR